MPNVMVALPNIDGALRDGAQMAIFADFFRPVFSASRVQHVSDLHLSPWFRAGEYFTGRHCHVTPHT